MAHGAPRRSFPFEPGFAGPGGLGGGLFGAIEGKLQGHDPQLIARPVTSLAAAPRRCSQPFRCHHDTFGELR